MICLFFRFGQILKFLHLLIARSPKNPMETLATPDGRRQFQGDTLLRWPRRPAAGVPPTRSTARPLVEPDWRHHGPRSVHLPGDGRGRVRRPDAAVSPNQSPQTTHRAEADPLVLDGWWSARSGP